MYSAEAAERTSRNSSTHSDPVADTASSSDHELDDSFLWNVRNSYELEPKIIRNSSPFVLMLTAIGQQDGTEAKHSERKECRQRSVK
jgi:hypothetical protein